MNDTGKDIDPSVESVALVEEVAKISTRDVVSGSVRVKTRTEDTEHLVSEALESQHVEFVRVAIGREVTEIPVVRVEGDLTIIPVFEEILVVEKRFVLKEEIHLTRQRKIETFESTVTLRRQHAVVDYIEADTPIRRTAPTKEEETP